MEILPAIDLRDGKVVRLIQGDYARQATYAYDPAAVAQTFLADGAAWIHVVDLDGAKAGRPVNTAAVKAILAAGAMVELGGGARTRQTIEEYLAMGAARVVVGSAALKDWPWFERLLTQADLAAKLTLGLDARDGAVAAEGWTQQLTARAVDFASRVKGSSLGAIVYTDINSDAMLGGVNVDATAEIVGATDVPVIASGGVSSLDDVRECKRIGCAGAIIGRAWYEGRIDLPEALRIAR